MSQNFQLSLDPYIFIRQLLSDPSTAAQVVKAITDHNDAEGKAYPLTERLGYANLGGDTQEEQRWFSLFMSTNQQGGIYRPRTEKGAHRISLRLREQTKTQAAQTKPATQLINLPDVKTQTEELAVALENDPQTAKALQTMLTVSKSAAKGPSRDTLLLNISAPPASKKREPETIVESPFMPSIEIEDDIPAELLEARDLNG